MVDTGLFTGRSPLDKYIVEEATSSENIWWGDVNRKISSEIFDELYQKVIQFYNHGDESNTYIFDGFGGAAVDHRLNVRIIAKKAWQAHFVHNMFIRPEEGELDGFDPGFTIINASDVSNKDFKTLGMNSETFILFHLGRRIALCFIFLSILRPVACVPLQYDAKFDSHPILHSLLYCYFLIIIPITYFSPYYIVHFPS